MALKARLHQSFHLFDCSINYAALCAAGGAIANCLAGVPWWLAFAPSFYAPALAIGLAVGLAAMPVYVVVVCK